MLNLPIVKFEKSCNYLNEQLTLQNNNKQLILDIISNIGLILNSSEEKFEQYDNILETANEFLKTISSNITSIEQLNVEIKNITAELTSLLSEQNKTSKTKEFYIAAFSNIKHNIIVYSKKFQELENTLAIDNNKFNEFINENNFKYNFVSIDDSTNSYTFTGFSINDTEEIIADVKNHEVSNNIDEVSKISEDIENVEVNTNKIEESNNNELLENIENSVEEISDELVENVENVVENSDELIEDIVEESTLENEEITSAIPENANKIDELTNEFKSLLLNISEKNLNDATSSVVSLFKELLPKEPSATFEDFLDLGNKSDEVLEEIETSNVNEENEDDETIFDAFDPIKIVDDYIIKDLEAIIYEEHSGLIYEFDKELDVFVSYKEEVIEEKEEIVKDVDEESVSNNTVVEENIDKIPEASDETSDLLVLDSISESSEKSDFETILEDSDEIVDNLIENLDLLSETSLLDEELLSSDDIKPESEIEILDSEHILNEDILNIENEILLENTEEFFTEDLSDVNEEIENTQDIELLIDNLEIIENVEKSIFEELNNKAENSISEALIDETIIVDIENSIVENEEIIEDIQDSTDIDIIDEESIIPDEISLSSFDLFNDIDLLDNFDDSIFDDDILNTIPSITDEATDELIENNSSKENVEEANQTEELQNVEHFYKDTNSQDAPFKNKGMSKKEFDDKLLKIENAIEDNKTLVISERTHKIYLPYKVSELENYVKSYPGSYSSLKDVVNQEFILPFDYFRKHPSKARFTEAYNLLKNREGRNFMKSVSYAFRLLNKNNLNPAIIASCKTQHELDSYLYYLDSDNLNNFKFFDIIYEVNPM